MAVQVAAVNVIGLAAGLRLSWTNSRAETAARPHFLAQGPDQSGIFGETLNEDRAGAFESGGRITHPLTRFDIPASHLLRVLVGLREKLLCQWFEARFAGELSSRPPLWPIGQIKILEPRLAVGRLDCTLKRALEFALLTDAVEDCGPPVETIARFPSPIEKRVARNRRAETCGLIVDQS